MTTSIFILIGYLIGSLSFAVIVSKAMGLPDPYSYGSGNPGATNVLRTGSKKGALLTLLGDALKGYVAVALAQWLGPRYGIGVEGIAAVAVAAFLGHLYPVFFGFKGGKGVATAAGILLALDGGLGLLVAATWLVVALVFRYSSLAAMLAAAVAPLVAVYRHGPGPFALAVFVMCALLIWRHRDNIRKLLAGAESKIGSRRRQ